MKPSVGWALVGMQFGVLSALLVFPAGDGWPRNWIVGAGAAALLMAGVLTAVVASFRLGTSLISGIPRLSKNIRPVSAALEQPFPAKKIAHPRVLNRSSSEV